ncbi:MAG: amidohydrolase [Gemmatimonadota bacterium]
MNSYFASLVLALLLTGCTRAPSADMVIFGRIWTGDPQLPWAQAVAITGDSILAVGDSATIATYIGKNTRRMDNGAAMVVPGFMDGHTHFLSGGYQLSSVDLRRTTSPAEFVSTLKAFAAERKPGEWILGGDWDHERWPGAPLPTRDWIDSVTPNNPVFISRLDGHMALANSAALRAAGLTLQTPDIAGGTIVRDPRTHEPTGILKDEAMGPVYAAVPEPSAEQDDAALTRAMAFVASKGVTAAAMVSSPWSELAALDRARKGGRLTIRATIFHPLEQWRAVAESVKARHGFGDDWIRLSGVKGYVDGSLGSGTALFYEPYDDDPRTRGLLTTPEDSLRAWIGASDSAGLQVAVHAIGQRANGLILDIYDSLAKAHGPRDRRFRIEHAQHLRPEDIDRIAATGVIASMQPAHLIDDGEWAQKRIGPDRIKTTYAFRSLIDRKAHLAFGSDWTVAPIDPLVGIYAAVTRRTRDNKNPEGWLPEQKISVEEALRSYTYENAYGVFGEEHRGMIRPGYLADLVLLDQDITRIPPPQIMDVRVKATIVGGKVIYQAEGQ